MSTKVTNTNTEVTQSQSKPVKNDSVGKRQLTYRPQPSDSDKDKYSLSITDMLYSLFDKAIQAEFSDLPDAAVLITASKVADYQCNSAMSISQVYY
jgi:hypothetical protein